MDDMTSDLPVKTIHANGMEFAYLEAGQGPLVILLHGFPDTAYCYRDVLPLLAAAGYRAIAPFLRGYAPTALAPDGDYRLPTLARDLIALVEHFGRGERAYVIGHDWGSAIAQYAVNLRPDRFEKILIASVPHLRRFLLSPTRQQLKRSHYILRFQIPLWAERKMVENDFAWMEEHLIRAWSPGWKYSAADLAPLKANFADPARLKAALAYYRALPGLLARPSEWKIAFADVRVPTCLVYGNEDGCVGPEMFQKQEKRFKAEFLLCEATGMGHFIPWENPAWLAERAIEFFGRKA